MEALERALDEIERLGAIISACHADAPPLAFPGGGRGSAQAAEALLHWAERRSALHESLAQREQRIMEHVKEAARQAGTRPSLNELEPKAPSLVRAIRRRLDDVKDALDALRASDLQRSQLLLRARAIVRGYLHAITPPPPTAYSRIGVATASSIRASTTRSIG